MIAWGFFSVAYFTLSFVFYKRQNEPGRLGGPIAKAKAFWLAYTIYSWFIFVPYLVLFKNPPTFYLQALAFLAVSMWLRGAIEMVMLFVTKNWTPPLGMSHDVFTLIGLFAWPWFRVGFPESFNAWTVLYLSFLLSLIVETYYAYAFFQLVREKTKGDEGIWYASAEDPTFRKIVRITAFFNFILYGALFYFIGVQAFAS